MNGFITESTSKITDGFGTAVYILVLYFFIYYVGANVESTFGKTGYILLILILLAAGIFMLTRALRAGKAEAQLADAGITAGVLLWQVHGVQQRFRQRRVLRDKRMAVLVYRGFGHDRAVAQDPPARAALLGARLPGLVGCGAVFKRASPHLRVAVNIHCTLSRRSGGGAGGGACFPLVDRLPLRYCG